MIKKFKKEKRHVFSSRLSALTISIASSDGVFSSRKHALHILRKIKRIKNFKVHILQSSYGD